MEYLSIVTLGPDLPQVISALAELITKYECHILRSRATSFGSDLATIAFICGNWNSMAKLEAALQSFGKNHEVTILINRTQMPTKAASALPYYATVVGLDDGNLINEVISFFVEQQIVIDDLNLRTNIVTATETPIFKLELILHIPTTLNIINLRNQFVVLCEELNIDGKIAAQLTD